MSEVQAVGDGGAGRIPPRGLHATRRRLLFLLAVVAVSATLAAGLLAWRLRRGAIDLAFAVPAVERALGRPGAFTVRIGGAELAWDVRDRRLTLRARDIHVLDARGTTVASVPAVALHPSPRALLHGRIAVGAVQLIGPRLRLVRNDAGGVDLGLGEGAGSARPEALRRLLPSSGPDAWLRRLEIRDGEIALADPATGRRWRVVGVEMSAVPAEEGLAVAFGGDVDTGSGVLPVRGDAVWRSGGSVADIRVGPVTPASLRPLLPESLGPIVAGIALPVAGSVRLDLDDGLAPRTVRVVAEASAGTVAIPDLLPAGFAVRAAGISAALDLTADTLAVESLSVQLPDARLEMHGTLADIRSTRRVETEARISRLPVDRLATYWPPTLARDAREWVTERVSGGMIDDANVRITGRMAESGFVDGDVSGSATFEKLAVRYLVRMARADGLAGTAAFTTDRWHFRVARGALAGLELAHATVDLDLAAGRVTVRAAVEGPLAAALAVARQARPERDLGLAGAEGQLAADVRLDLPPGARLRPDAVALAISARLHDVAVPHAVRRWSFSDGDLDVDFRDEALAVAGRGRVDGVPVTIDWREGKDGDRRVDVTSHPDSADRAALGFDLEPWVEGPVDVRARLLQKQGAGTVDVTANLKDARVSVPVLAVAKPAGAPGAADARVVLAGGVATAVDHLSFSAGGASVSGRAALAAGGTALGSLDVTATIGARDTAQPPGHVTFALGAGQGDAHPFVLTSDDAGALFRAIAPTTEATGGRLRYAGTIDLGATGVPVDGRLELHDFRLLRSPLVARVATLSSLSGIADLLQGRGQGLAFDRLDAGIASRGTTITLTDAIARGPSVNILIAGSVERSDWTATARGTLVPSYYGLNAAPGRVPVLGALLAGSGRQGIQAFDFDASGPISSPEVHVRLSSLAPGVLRDIARRLPGIRR